MCDILVLVLGFLFVFVCLYVCMYYKTFEWAAITILFLLIKKQELMLNRVADSRVYCYQYQSREHTD